MIREILKMGDPRLLEVAKPVERFDTPELHEIVADMFETMHHANGAGLAAPQLGIGLQIIIFGFALTNGLREPGCHPGLRDPASDAAKP